MASGTIGFVLFAFAIVVASVAVTSVNALDPYVQFSFDNLYGSLANEGSASGPSASAVVLDAFSRAEVPCWRPRGGHRGGALLLFENQTVVFSSPSMLNFDPTVSTFLVSIWAKPLWFGRQQTLVSRAAATASGASGVARQLQLSLLSDNRPMAVVGGAQVIGNFQASSSEWHQYTVGNLADLGVFFLAVDGVELGRAAFGTESAPGAFTQLGLKCGTFTPASPSSPAQCGGGVSAAFYGFVDDFRVHLDDPDASAAVLFALTQTAVPTSLSAVLALYFPFEENTVDSGGAGSPRRLRNFATVSGSDRSWGEFAPLVTRSLGGAIGSSLHSTGSGIGPTTTTGYVRVWNDPDSDFRIGRDEFSVSVWAALQRLGRSSLLVARGDSGMARQLMIRVSATNAVEFLAGQSLKSTVANFITDSAWHMYTLVVAQVGQSTRFDAYGYVDGVRVVSFTTKADYSGGPAYFSLMGQEYNDAIPAVFPIVGRIDEFRVFRAALTASEVAAQFAQQVPLINGTVTFFQCRVPLDSNAAASPDSLGWCTAETLGGGSGSGSPRYGTIAPVGGGYLDLSGAPATTTVSLQVNVVSPPAFGFNLDYSEGTLSLWMFVPGSTVHTVADVISDSGGGSGGGSGSATTSSATVLMSIRTDGKSNLRFFCGDTQLAVPFARDNWHMVTLTRWRDFSMLCTGYVDGIAATNFRFTPTTGGGATRVCVGRCASANTATTVMVDDVRFLSRALPAYAIVGLYNARFAFSSSPSLTVSASRSGTRTPSRTPTTSRTSTRSLTASRSPIPSNSPTSSITPSSTASSSRSATSSVSVTPSVTGSSTGSSTVSLTSTGSVSATVSVTGTGSSTLSPSQTATSSVTASQTGTVTASVTSSISKSSTPTSSVTPSGSATVSATETGTNSATYSSTPSETYTSSSSQSGTVTVTASRTASNSATESGTNSATYSSTSSETYTPSSSRSGTVTRTQTPTSSFSGTVTSSATASISDSPTGTPTSSASPSVTRTSSMTSTITPSPSATRSVGFGGCTDPNGQNFNPLSVVDDGSCQYADCTGSEPLSVVKDTSSGCDFQGFGCVGFPPSTVPGTSAASCGFSTQSTQSRSVGDPHVTTFQGSYYDNYDCNDYLIVDCERSASAGPTVGNLGFPFGFSVFSRQVPYVIPGRTANTAFTVHWYLWNDTTNSFPARVGGVKVSPNDPWATFDPEHFGPYKRVVSIMAGPSTEARAKVFVGCVDVTASIPVVSSAAQRTLVQPVQQLAGIPLLITYQPFADAYTVLFPNGLTVVITRYSAGGRMYFNYATSVVQHKDSERYGGIAGEHCVGSWGWIGNATKASTNRLWFNSSSSSAQYQWRVSDFRVPIDSASPIPTCLPTTVDPLYGFPTSCLPAHVDYVAPVAAGDECSGKSAEMVALAKSCCSTALGAALIGTTAFDECVRDVCLVGTCAPVDAHQNAQQVQTQVQAADTPTATSCLQLLESKPSLIGKDGLYSIHPPNPPSSAPSSGVVQVYCDMTSDGGGWTRIVSVDPTVGCPVGWSSTTINSVPIDSTGLTGTGGSVTCDRTITETDTDNNTMCSSASFSSFGISFTQVRGSLVAYAFNDPIAFAGSSLTTPSLDSYYVDGVSLTVGSEPRTHLWTYAVGATDHAIQGGGGGGGNQMKQCPCSPQAGTAAPSFIGNDWYCESGNPTGAEGEGFGWHAGNSSQLLFNGASCQVTGSQCCSRSSGGGLLATPMFSQTLGQTTTSAVEARICTHDSPTVVNIGVKKLELLIRESYPDMDTDGDGRKRTLDNCPSAYNPLQENFDGDQYGDACDPCVNSFSNQKDSITGLCVCPPGQFDNGKGFCVDIPPTPSVTITRTPTTTVTPSNSPTTSTTASLTPSISQSVSPTKTPPVSPTPSTSMTLPPSISASPTISVTSSISRSASSTLPPSVSNSVTTSQTPTVTPSRSLSASLILVNFARSPAYPASIQSYSSSIAAAGTQQSCVNQNMLSDTLAACYSNGDSRFMFADSDGNQQITVNLGALRNIYGIGAHFEKNERYVWDFFRMEVSTDNVNWSVYKLYGTPGDNIRDITLDMYAWYPGFATPVRYIRYSFGPPQPSYHGSSIYHLNAWGV